MKKCFKCEQEKEINEFYTHKQMADGHLNKCKDCARKDVSERENRMMLNPEWLASERARHREKQARYRVLGLAKETTFETRRNWATRNPHKRAAHQICAIAVKSGLLKRPACCNRCGSSNCRLEKHHEDYSHPLSVEWLCPACHGKTRRLPICK